MSDSFFMGLAGGLFYAYVGLMVVLFTIDRMDTWIERKYGDSVIAHILLVVFWVLMVPAVLLFGVFRRWHKAYKLNQLV